MSRDAVSRAVKEAGTKLANLQRCIIEHLTDYRLQEETHFWVLRHPDE